MTDVYIRVITLPCRIYAVTTPNTDGTFDVYVNGRLSDEQQQAALRHELNHIRKDHFYDLNPVRRNEKEAEEQP